MLLITSSFEMIQKNLLHLKDHSLDQILGLFQKADSFKKGLKVPFFLPKNPILANVFLEASTRTRVSFEIAAKNLDFSVVNLSSEGSSLEKGETLLDTLLNLEAMGTKIFCVRLKEEGLLEEIATKLKTPIINAGSGRTAHPSQALLDFYTLKEHFSDLQGKRILYIGDIDNSRVVSSHKELHEKFKVKAEFLSLEEANIVKKIDASLSQADAVYLLRVQEERLKTPMNISKNDYHARFGLTLERFKKLKTDCIVMHPGPFVPDKEISTEILQHPNVKILKQVQNSIPIRMAILQTLLEEAT
jgi:aspartate carbamoyltransferase catalytic subunit